MTNNFKEFDGESSDDMSESDGSLASDSYNISDSEEELSEEIEAQNNEGKEEADTDNEDDDDEVVKAIKAEKVKSRDHPQTIESEDFIVDISFHPANNIIALANIVGDVQIYEYSNDENKLLHNIELHLKACRNVEFDTEGNTMYTAGKDKNIMVTDFETRKLKRSIENAHEVPVYSMKCLNDKIVTGDDAGTVKMWDMRQNDPVFSIKIGEETVTDMITNNAEKYLVCAGGDGVLTSIDLKGSKIYSVSEEYDSELTCLGLFRTETKLLAGSCKGKLYLFNWKQFGYHSDEYIGHKHTISCMVPITENIVVTSGEDGVIRAAHMFPQKQLGVVGQHKMPVERLDISHDGQLIASCSHDQDVKFWNISYFEGIDEMIDVTEKQNKRKDMGNNLPSSSVKNASDFFSGLA